MSLKGKYALNIIRLIGFYDKLYCRGIEDSRNVGRLDDEQLKFQEALNDVIVIATEERSMLLSLPMLTAMY